MITLCLEDQELCGQFDRRLQIVRDRTKGAHAGWHTGFYLWGDGGISKSWTVVDELETLKANYRVTNTRLTAKGLFELLEDFPDIVHVLEDMESLCTSPNAAGVLRSALWTTNPKTTQQHQERLVTWRVASEKREVIFTGSIILTMNMPLDDLPALRAVKTRIPHLHLQPTNAEVRAKMRQISTHGFQHGEGVLSPEESMEVCNHVIEKCDEAGKNYDMRMLVGGFRDRLQHAAGDSEHDWMDLVESRLNERVTLHAYNRVAKVRDEATIAHEINSMTISRDEKVKLWKERTGRSKNSFYRRLQTSG